MPSLALPEIQGGYNILDFGVLRGVGDAGPAINAALTRIAGQSEAGGTCYFPPGTYLIRTPISVPSNIEVAGFGSRTILQLRNSGLVDVLTSRDTSNVRIRTLRIDGNRSNNTGNGQGLWLENVTDAWIEDVEVVSCRSDGFRLDGCTRVELKGPSASDNGRHGFSLANTEFCQLLSPRAYDNSQVADAGDGDGINLELFSRWNTIVCPVCYETAGVGDRQGYGVREASASGCERNLIIGGSFNGNRTAAIVLDSGDSGSLAVPLISLPMGALITP